MYSGGPEYAIHRHMESSHVRPVPFPASPGRLLLDNRVLTISHRRVRVAQAHRAGDIAAMALYFYLVGLVDQDR